MQKQENRQKAIEVLQATHTGDDLSNSDFLLVCQGVSGPLSEGEKQRFDLLYDAVKSGTYPDQSLFGLKHLRRDAEGNIFFKGAHVLHTNSRWLASKEARPYLTEFHQWCVQRENSGQKINYALAMLRDTDKELLSELGEDNSPTESVHGSRDALLEQIAQKCCSVETLETRRSDSLDFHNISVWGLKSALEQAFEAGADHQMEKLAAVELPEPEVDAVDEVMLREALTSRLDQNLVGLMAALHTEISTPDLPQTDIVSLAERIAATSAACDYLKEHYSLPLETTQFLLQFENPLALVAEHWPAAKDDLLDFSSVLEDVMENSYHLDPLAGDDFVAEKSPPEQLASGKSSVLADLQECRKTASQSNPAPPGKNKEETR